ncbi:MAG: hypothetical protein HY924_00865 [Elusimicrobia bacterium]|nr:hypothetical protein [Elusimicrobiota bacterium]
MRLPGLVLLAALLPAARGSVQASEVAASSDALKPAAIGFVLGTLVPLNVDITRWSLGSAAAETRFQRELIRRQAAGLPCDPDPVELRGILKLRLRLVSGRLTFGQSTRRYPTHEEFSLYAGKARDEIKAFVEGLKPGQSLGRPPHNRMVGRILERTVDRLIRKMPVQFGAKASNPPPLDEEEEALAADPSMR